MIAKICRMLAVTCAAVLFLSSFVMADAPLTLEESISIALKNSLVISIARKGPGEQKRKRGRPLPDSFRNSALHTTILI